MHNWFNTELGNCFTAEACAHIPSLVPYGYHGVALQIGAGGQDLLADIDCGERIYVVPPGCKLNGARVCSDWDALPFERRSMDLVVLFHALDFGKDPGGVLREVSEILAPEGYLVVLGLNPFGIWGICRLLKFHKNTIPWTANYFPLTRVQDWINLLGFATVGGTMYFYRPPVNSELILRRLKFMEAAGRRWWPALSGAYILVAKNKALNTHTKHLKNVLRGRRQRHRLQTLSRKS
jgi:SAM-dependent methyltransferase